MPTSGSSDFIVTAEEIITEALRHIHILSPGATASSDKINSHLKTLNMMAKALVPRGLSIWCTERLTIFLEKEQTSYTVGDRIAYTDTVVRTKLVSDAADKATSIEVEVESAAGIEDTDAIGIQQDNSTIHWTTVNGAPSGNIINLTASLTAPASSGNVVYSFSKSIADFEVKEVLQVFLRHKDLSDTPLNIISRQEYWDLGDKTNAGAPNQIYFKQDRSTPTFFIYPTNDVATDTVELVIRRNIEDFDSQSNNPDFPQEWFEALSFALAWRLANQYKLPMSERQYLGQQAQFAIENAESYDKEQVSVYLAPEMRFRR